MKTVKVRIAVAVDATGRWCAYAYSDEHGNLKTGQEDVFVDDMKDGEAYYWVTAELPIPEVTAVDVPGEVEK